MFMTEAPSTAAPTHGATDASALPVQPAHMVASESVRVAVDDGIANPVDGNVTAADVTIDTRGDTENSASATHEAAVATATVGVAADAQDDVQTAACNQAPDALAAHGAGVNSKIATAMEEVQGALEILRKVPWERKEPAMSLLLKLLTNIHTHPDRRQYRKLNEFNEKLSTQLFSVPGSLEFLEGVGFQHSQVLCSDLVLVSGNTEVNGPVDLYRPEEQETLAVIQGAMAKLRDFIAWETGQRQRTERNERIAAERAADEKTSAMKCRARPALQEEERTRRGNLSQSSTAAAAQITVHLQKVSTTFSVIVPIDETVGYLRTRAAERGRHYSHQVRLVSSSTGDLLRWDSQKLRDCGIGDDSLVMFSIGALDEMEVGNKELAERFGEVGKIADKDSWAFTRAYLEAAEENGLPSEKSKEFKRSLHSGALSLQEIRNLIAQEMQEITGTQGEAAPLEEVKDTYLCHKRAAVTLTQAEKDRMYSMKLARDNAAGLLRASQACGSGRPRPYYM